MSLNIRPPKPDSLKPNLLILSSTGNVLTKIRNLGDCLFMYKVDRIVYCRMTQYWFSLNKF